MAYLRLFLERIGDKKAGLFSRRKKTPLEVEQGGGRFFRRKKATAETTE